MNAAVESDWTLQLDDCDIVMEQRRSTIGRVHMNLRAEVHLPLVEHILVVHSDAHSYRRGCRYSVTLLDTLEKW